MLEGRLRIGIHGLEFMLSSSVFGLAFFGT